MDATQSVRMDSYQPVRMVDNQPTKTAPVEQKVAPSKETTSKKPTDGNEKSKHEKKS
ncbi:hypothetical protein KIN20_035085 [Parelaphostrongylus tenuis]|uniref:Uncharacterized protein n=1 Tax=Parelaphostrongylus tenuis TaxID=148309 RepID=A0AAD5RBB3_PARTN|nr:hypothetical protein KIN20_035085 [Parelaphostrongylus tenuis]